MTTREQALALHAAGRKQIAIARELNVSRASVSRWVRYARGQRVSSVSAWWFDVGAA